MYEFINFIILFGVVQGFILSLILFFSSKNKQSGKYFLGVLLLILVYNGLETLNWSTGWNSFLFSIYTFTSIFGIGPSVYLYVKSFNQASYHTFRQISWYYLPVFIQFILRSILVSHWILGDNHQLTRWLDSWHSAISEPLSMILAAIYVGLAWLEFQKIHRNSSDSSLLPEEKALIMPWLAWFLIFMSIIVLMWALSLLAIYFIPQPTYFSFYYPTEIALVLLIYWIGFTGYHQVYIIQVAIPKMESSILQDFSETEIQHCITILKNAMEKEKLYLDNELTVSKLANYLKMNPKTISAILNQQIHKGFNEFVNEYRVEEVKRQMLNPDNQHLTITGIAFEAGFNSQATFQRVFKNIVGMTPSEYLAQNQAFNKA